jgi:hypothetical protein
LPVAFSHVVPSLYGPAIASGAGLTKPLYAHHMETRNSVRALPAILNAAESRLHREAALEVRRIDSGS